MCVGGMFGVRPGEQTQITQDETTLITWSALHFKQEPATVYRLKVKLQLELKTSVTKLI